MKIVFILPMINSAVYWHQGVASLATCCEKAGYDAFVYELYSTDFSDCLLFLEELNPDIVAATANIHQLQYIEDLFFSVKRKFSSVITMIGGVAVTIAPDSLKKPELFDYICRGEGEVPIVSFMEQLQSGRISDISAPNIFNGQESPNAMKCSYLIDDLDSLPIAKRDYFSWYRNAEKNATLPFVVRFLFCRGCPFDCTYCCNKVIKQVFPEGKSYVRRPSVKRVLDEISLVSEQYAFNHYVIDDDTFTLDKAWARDFCEQYHEKLKDKTFEVNIRVGTVNYELFQGLYDCGCRLVKIGLESGDENIRKRVLNRNITDDMILETVSWAKKAGLDIHTFNMVGIPGETAGSIVKTIRLNQKIAPTRLQVTVFYPYKNTKLGKYCEDNDMIAGFDDSYFSKSTIRHDKLPSWLIRFFALTFKACVYARYSAAKCFQEIITVFAGIFRLIPGGAFCVKAIKRVVSCSK